MCRSDVSTHNNYVIHLSKYSCAKHLTQLILKQEFWQLTNSWHYHFFFSLRSHKDMLPCKQCISYVGYRFSLSWNRNTFLQLCALDLVTLLVFEKLSLNCIMSLKVMIIYRMRTIITRGLYTFYPLFEVQKRFFKGLFFLKFWPYVWLVFKSGF